MASFSRCVRARKQTKIKAYSLIKPVTRNSSDSDVMDNDEGDELDYLPCIQQEAAGKNSNDVSLFIHQ
jgi:hypothetical protein